MKITKDQILENLDQVKQYISEIDNKPKIEEGTLYWSINEINEKNYSFWGNDNTDWGNDNTDNRRLKNHNLYLIEADCDKQIAKNEALNKIKTYIKDNNLENKIVYQIIGDSEGIKQIKNKFYEDYKSITEN